MSPIARCLILFILFSTHALFAAERPNILERFPADISFIIFDLKYNEHEGVKICEIQPGSMSVFSGYDYLMGGDGLVPDMLCDVLTKYQSNVWYMEKTISDRKCKNKFMEMGWKNIKSIDALLTDTDFINASAMPVNDPHNLYDYHGMLYVKPQKVSLEQLRAQFPGIIILDAALFSHIRDKHSMDLLLKSSPKLSNLRPKSKVYPKIYSEDLAESIVKEIHSDFLVIKPVNSTRGQGVILVDRNNLDSTLQAILVRENSGKLMLSPDRAYTYWADDRSHFFLVEQFIESVHVSVPQFDNKIYDGTMRAVGLLLYHQQKVEFVLLEGHWKIPKKSLSDEGTFTEKHKSFGNAPHFLQVDTAIFEAVKLQLQEGFEELYMNCNVLQ